jgi:hypothetical protein
MQRSSDLPNPTIVLHDHREMCFYSFNSANMRSFILTLALVGLAGPAMATTCEESFDKKGDFFNGSAFAAKVQVEGLTVEDAFARLRPILARESIKTLSADVGAGVMRAENPATFFQRALPIDVYATKAGSLLNVEMVFTLPSGVGAKKDTVKGYLCRALNQLLPAETTPAKPAPAKTEPAKTEPAAPAIEIEATALAKQVKESADNPARIRLNFIGKTFRVSGKVQAIGDNNGAYTVSLDGAQPANSGAKKVAGTMVVCAMAKGQDAAVAALQINQRSALTGTFQSFDSKTNVILLQDCIGQ